MHDMAPDFSPDDEKTMRLIPSSRARWLVHPRNMSEMIAEGGEGWSEIHWTRGLWRPPSLNIISLGELELERHCCKSRGGRGRARVSTEEWWAETRGCKSTRFSGVTRKVMKRPLMARWRAKLMRGMICPESGKGMTRTWAGACWLCSMWNVNWKWCYSENECM